MKQRGFLDGEGKVCWEEVSRQIPGVSYLGSATSEELSKVFSQASLLLVGSRIPETFGLVSIEAQACGCIPVIPNHGGLPETIEENMTGVSYEMADVGDLTSKIEQLLSPNFGESLNHWRSQAIRHVRENYSWDLTGQRISMVVGRVAPHGWKNGLLARFRKLGRTVKQQWRATVRTRSTNGEQV